MRLPPRPTDKRVLSLAFDGHQKAARGAAANFEINARGKDDVLLRWSAWYLDTLVPSL